MSPFSPSHDPSVILYLVLHFSEVWKCGIVWKSKDNVTIFPRSRTLCYSLLSSTLLRGVEVWKNDKALMTGGIVRQYPYFVRLFHTSTPLRSMELRLVKNDKGFMTGGNARQYPYFVRLFHISTPLRSVELSEEWQGVYDWGKGGTISLLCQTIPHFHTSEKCGTK